MRARAMQRQAIMKRLKEERRAAVLKHKADLSPIRILFHAAWQKFQSR
jgi:hypothetical protein